MFQVTVLDESSAFSKNTSYPCHNWLHSFNKRNVFQIRKEFRRIIHIIFYGNINKECYVFLLLFRPLSPTILVSTIVFWKVRWRGVWKGAWGLSFRWNGAACHSIPEERVEKLIWWHFAILKTRVGYVN